MACALRASGQATCWGDDSSGQLAVSTVSDVRSVTAGPTTACAIRLGRGEVACFGRHATYAFEDGSRGALSVATSLDAALLVTGDQSIWSWGSASTPPDFISPLGRIVSAPTAEPATIPDLHGVSTIAAGAEHACALASGKVFCWGNNTYGQLGSGSRAPSEVPVEVFLPEDAHATSLALSERTTCAVTDDGRAFCWGANDIGELGNGDDAPHFGPMPVRSLGARIVEMAAMDFTTCALLETGTIVCWGYNGFGGLGIGTTDFELHSQPSAVRFDAEEPMRDQ
jgi:alpha-tubulin suppressor-like RCC1 family protein